MRISVDPFYATKSLSQRSVCVLQEWSWYEEVTERLCKQLDEMETDLSSLDLEPEGDLNGQQQSYEVSFPHLWEC